MPARRVVITGVGAVCPLGRDADTLRDAFRRLSPGVRRIASYDASAMPTQIAGEVGDFDPRAFLDRREQKSLKLMARTARFAVVAARIAMEEAAFAWASSDPTRLGVILGSSTVLGNLAELGPAAHASLDADGVIDMQAWGRVGMHKMQPMWMLMHVPNMAACHVSILHDAQGPCNTLTMNDVAGLLALGEACRTIRRGSADAMLAGGTEVRTPPVGVVRYSLFGNPSRRNDDPENACRPFDRDRDGQVVAEGAGVFLLESLETAAARNAPIRAEILGFASGFDRGRTGRGIARLIRRVLAESQLSPSDIDHVNAHGLGGVEDDPWEARGIAEALPTTPVVAIKGQIGNLGAGASPVELLASLLLLKDGTRPGTRNCDNIDPACPITVSRDPAPATGRTVLKLALTELGHAAAMAVRLWPE